MGEFVFENNHLLHAGMSESILLRIQKQRLLDVAEAKQVRSLEDLKASLSTAPPVLDFVTKIQSMFPTAVLAEIKRASPSKGDIKLDVDVAETAKAYARAGCCAISVLTEPTWFKGSLEDMSSVRKVVENFMGSARPAVLRKDFIVDEYQIYEGRVYGADTVLLIVAILTDTELYHFLEVSRALGMEPLVEVANEEEMKRALAANARVIGINNRNLHTFSVDPGTTERLVQQSGEGAESDRIFIALSGISSRVDVQRYRCAGVQAVLVGEALMRSERPTQLIQSFRGCDTRTPLVKICGCKDSTAALCAVRNGADFVGLVFAESSRKVTTETAVTIGSAIRSLNNSGHLFLKDHSGPLTSEQLQSATMRGPLLVGVFADQPVEYVNDVAIACDLDIIQLSGDETFTNVSEYVRPVVKAVHVDSSISWKEVVEKVKAINTVALLDTKDVAVRGGTGRTFDWDLATHASKHVPFFLAGGLSPENVEQAVRTVCPFALDVSSGVETNKEKDFEKIVTFIARAKLTEDGLVR
eukprot:c7929_g1_i1.p1 GENE.c7929_g1_i1~~c7929_g1_i1.p1  ORF type:complete len:528 (+),score=113.40 c7929_g1_i1:1-1584(+)